MPDKRQMLGASLTGGAGAALAVLALALTLVGEAAASGFSVKPAEISVDPSLPVGSLRRSFQPFGDWTIVCDDNLKTRRRVCNISQTIVNDAGETAFSWSLAATPGGEPVMVLRAPREAGGTHVRLAYGIGKPVEVTLPTCDATLCVGILPVGPDLRRAIASGNNTTVSTTRAGGTFTFDVPTRNLSAALASLKSGR